MIVLKQYLTNLRSSFWFLPGLIVLGCMLLALGLIQADSWAGKQFFDDWPRLFGGGADGARGLLSVIASSMISVTGVVFSITLVALTLASSQYTPRVLRNFMRDRLNQTVLGVFLGIFAYAMVVLRTIRGPDEGLFVPSLAVLMGLLMGLIGIGFLVFYIHHIAVSIQASQILASVYAETRDAVDRLFPHPLDGDAGDGAAEEVAHRVSHWQSVRCHHTGYLQQINLDVLRKFAEDRDTVVRMERSIGEFLMEGMPMLSVAGEHPPDRDAERRLRAVCMVDLQRNVEQDVAFGIRQMVDVALKGLSPGINDTTTAVMSIDYITAVLARLGERRIDCHHRGADGRVRILHCGPGYIVLLDKAFEQIRQNANGNMAVLSHMLGALRILADRTHHPARCRALLSHVRAVGEVGNRSIQAPTDRQHVDNLSVELVALLEGRSANQP